MRRGLLCGCLFLMPALCLMSGCGEKAEQEEKNSIRLGVSIYRWEDAFVSTLRAELEEKAKEYEQETGLKVVLDIVSGQGAL